MKRIEDAPKELQKMFADVWERVVYSAGGISDYRDEVEHAFLKGFDTAMATGGLPERPKRTVSRFHSDNHALLVQSSDGRLYLLSGLQNGKLEWIPYPDLPQD